MLCVLYLFIYATYEYYLFVSGNSEIFHRRMQKKEENLRGCGKAKTLSVLAVYSSTSSSCVIPGSSDCGWSACIPYMSINFEIGGILGSARPVMLGACFKPSLCRICPLITSRPNARSSSCFLQALQALPAIAKCRTWVLSMPGASKAPRRTSESNNSALVIILFKVALGWINYDRPSSWQEWSDDRYHRHSFSSNLSCLPSETDLRFSRSFVFSFRPRKSLIFDSYKPLFYLLLLFPSFAIKVSFLVAAPASSWSCATIRSLLVGTSWPSYRHRAPKTMLRRKEATGLDHDRDSHDPVSLSSFLRREAINSVEPYKSSTTK